MGTAVFLLGREVTAYVALKREVAELKGAMATMQDSFTRATDEQMTFVRQATTQLVDLSAAHRALEEAVKQTLRGGVDARVGRAASDAGVGEGRTTRDDAEGARLGSAMGGATPASRGGGGGRGRQAEPSASSPSKGRGRERLADGGGGAGKLRGAATGASDESLWETNEAEAAAAGGLTRNVKVGHLPWDR